jgi:predicted Ser/Thr protein kinase
MSQEETREFSAKWTPPTVAELAGRFPELELLELFGRGGMGAVYKARQKALNRLVAVKILPPEIGGNPAFATRFAREAQALASLNHPNIVTIYDFGERDGLYFFIMEFVDGVNLRQLLETARVSPREALAIVPQICDALQCAHDQGIVHRDIKPENILLDRQGRVKIADFGLAKLIQENGGELPVVPLAGGTETLAAVGTPSYMAPEQIAQPGTIDHRADIYALGVVFYQMLTGELPGKELKPPSQRVQIDVRLDEVVLRALEKNPRQRYQQASVFKTQVETIAGTPPEFRSPFNAKPEYPASPSMAELKPWFRKAAWAILWLSLCVVAVKAGQAQIRRMSFMAEFDIQAFVINLETASALPGARTATPLPGSQILALELSREEFMQLKERAQNPNHLPLEEHEVDVSVWSKAKDDWMILGANFGTRWTGSLGIGRKGDGLEASLDYKITLAGVEHARLRYQGLVQLTKVKVFLLPVKTSFVVLGVQVASDKLLGSDFSRGGCGNGHCAKDGNTVLFALYTTPWQCGAAFEPDGVKILMEGGPAFSYLYDKSRPASITINKQVYNLHNGTLLVLSEDGSIEQCPVFPTPEILNDRYKLDRLAESRAKRFRAKYFGPWMMNTSIHLATEATSQIFLDLDSGKSVSVPREIQSLMIQRSQLEATQKKVQGWLKDWVKRNCGNGISAMIDDRRRALDSKPLTLEQLASQSNRAVNEVFGQIDEWAEHKVNNEVGKLANAWIKDHPDRIKLDSPETLRTQLLETQEKIKAVDEKIDEWTRLSGADLMVDMDPVDPREALKTGSQQMAATSSPGSVRRTTPAPANIRLILYGGIVSSIDSKSFNFASAYRIELKAAQALEQWEKTPRSLAQPAILQSDQDAAMLFRTREGHVGTLQWRKDDFQKSRILGLNGHLVQPLPPVATVGPVLPEVQPPGTRKVWPGTAEVKLVAINNHPSWTGWWRPDGSPAGLPAFKDDGIGLVKSGQSLMPRYVALDLSELPADTSELILRANADAGPIENVINLDRYLLKDGASRTFVPAKLHRLGLSVPRQAKTFTLRVGVRFGPWENIATCAKSGTITVNPQGNAAVVPISFRLQTSFKQLYATIGIAPSSMDGEMQLVAVTTDNRQIKGDRQYPSSRFDDEVRIAWIFDKLPEDKVKEFQLRANLYHWTVFPNLPAQPVRASGMASFEAITEAASLLIAGDRYSGQSDVKITASVETFTAERGAMVFHKDSSGSNENPVVGPATGGFILTINRLDQPPGRQSTPSTSQGPYWKNFSNTCYDPDSKQGWRCVFAYSPLMNKTLMKSMLELLGDPDAVSNSETQTKTRTHGQTQTNKD